MFNETFVLLKRRVFCPLACAAFRRGTAIAHKFVSRLTCTSGSVKNEAKRLVSRKHENSVYFATAQRA